MRGQFMFSKNRKKIILLAVLSVFANAGNVYAEDTGVAPVSASSLPINVAEQGQKKADVAADSTAGALVSPSKAQAVAKDESNPAQVTEEAKPSLETPAVAKEEKSADDKNAAVSAPQNKTETTDKAKEKAPEASTTAKDDKPAPDAAKNDFDFDLKMKSIDSVGNGQATADKAQKNNNNVPLTDADLPKDIQYKVNPMENLGNSVLSQMDSDLFTQMSEIEKSTTLLTLELRREKIRNEIEAQKAIRQKNADDLERQKAEAELKNLERKKQIEAQVLREKRFYATRQQLFYITERS